jgi:hypothetical protein
MLFIQLSKVAELYKIDHDHDQASTAVHSSKQLSFLLQYNSGAYISHAYIAKVAHTIYITLQ